MSSSRRPPQSLVCRELQNEVTKLSRDVIKTRERIGILKQRAGKLATLFKMDRIKFDAAITKLFTSPAFALQRDIISHMIQMIPLKKSGPFTQNLLDLGRIARTQMGRANYLFLRRALVWPGITTLNDHADVEAHLKTPFSTGPFERAKRTYKNGPCLTSCDGTRIMRRLGLLFLDGYEHALPENKRKFIEITGVGLWGNLELWPLRVTLHDILERYKEPGDLCEMTALRRFVRETQAPPTLLAGEVRVHNFVPIDTEHKPITSSLWPRSPAKGGLTFYNVWTGIIKERRLAFLDHENNLLPQEDWLALIGIAMDPEPGHHKATQRLMKPDATRPEFIKYIGLGRPWEKLATPVIGPLPCIFFGDWDHVVRLFYKRLSKFKYTSNKEKIVPVPLVLYRATETAGNQTEEIVVSFDCLTALLNHAKDEGDVCGYAPSDLAVCLYFDQKTDAALKVFSRHTIHLLNHYNIANRLGFCLYAGAVLDLVEPISNTPETSPGLRIQSMTKALAFFRHWTVYVKTHPTLVADQTISNILMENIEQLVAARIAYHLTMYHWFRDFTFTEKLVAQSSVMLEEYMGFLGNKTNSSARPGTTCNTMAETYDAAGTAQDMVDAKDRLIAQDKKLATVGQKRRRTVNELLTGPGMKYSYAKYMPIAANQYPEAIEYLAEACEAGFKLYYKEIGEVHNGALQSQMEGMGKEGRSIFGMDNLIEHLDCIKFQTLKSGVLFDGSDKHMEQITADAEHTLQYMEIRTAPEKAANMKQFKTYQTRTERMFDWATVMRHVDSDYTPNANLNVQCNTEPDIVSAIPEPQSTLPYELCNTIYTAPVEDLVFDLDAPDVLQDDLQPRDDGLQPRDDEPPTTEHISEDEQRLVHQVDNDLQVEQTILANRSLSALLKDNNLANLKGASHIGLGAITTQLHEITLTRAQNGEIPSIRVRELNKNFNQKQDEGGLWITNAHVREMADMSNMTITFYIHVAAALRYLLCKRERISRERFWKFASPGALEYFKKRPKGITLWICSVIVYTRSTGVVALGLIKLLSRPKGSKPKKKNTTTADTTTTDNNKKKHKPCSKKKKVTVQPKRERVRECSDSTKGLLITCGRYYPADDKANQRNYVLDAHSIDENIESTAVLAFSNDTSMQSLHMQAECVRIDEGTLALINGSSTRKATTVDSNDHTKKKGKKTRKKKRKTTKSCE
jgi:hypothetical protein